MAVATKPLFRQDLFAEAIDEDGARFVDVMDDSTGVGFRFYETEYSIACAMDGERDVAAIVDWADQELGLRPLPTEVQRVIAKLYELGFVDDGSTTAAAARAPTSQDDIITAPIELQPTATASTTASENPHEVITTPTAKLDPDELGPASPVSTNVVARSSATDISTAKPALAKVSLASVPAAKAIVPPKRQNEELATAVPKPVDEDATVIASDDELAPGVITAAALSSPRIPVENVELGHVERNVLDPMDATNTSIASDLDLELGQPGATTPTPITNIKVDDMQLGNAGATAAKREVSDVSIALTDHVQLDKNDVRDAVRASQVMKAVDPADVDALEKAAAAESAAAKTEAAAKTTDAAKTDAAKTDAAKTDAAKTDAARTDAAKTDAAAAKTDKAAATSDTTKKPAPDDARPATELPVAPSGSPLKWVAAIAALAAAVFLVYNFALKQDDTPKNTAGEQQPIEDKAAADKAAADKAAADKAAADKAAADKAAADKLAADQAAAGSAGSGSAAGAGSDQAAADQAAADKAAADKAAADKAANASANKAAAAAAAKARAKARADAAAREKAQMEKLLEKQRKALEERKKQQEAAGGGAPAPAPTPAPEPTP